MLWRTICCALLFSTSLLATQDVSTPHDGKKEDIYVIRSVRTSRITPTEYCAQSHTGFADTVFEDRYVFHPVTTRAEDGAVLLEISDTGTGMNEEIRAHCLEPFFSTKGEKGTGLGLSMVFGIIKRHNGTLDIESAVGRGSTFRIRLPAELAVRFRSRPHAGKHPPGELSRPVA